MNAGYQSYIYELPADVGEFKKGTLIFTGCCHSKKNTKLPIYTSTDLGKTWTGHGNVAIGNGFNDGGWSSDGIWEPVVMYENGRLYCFYSDELENGNPSTHAGGHNQRLVYKYTTDMKNWSEIHEMVALDDPALRPGMVELTRMGNGKWALAYEMVGEKGSPIYLKFAEALDSWIPAEKGKIIKNNLGKPDYVYCSTDKLDEVDKYISYEGDTVVRTCVIWSFEDGSTVVINGTELAYDDGIHLSIQNITYSKDTYYLDSILTEMLNNNLIDVKPLLMN
jgi:hypothetical protein